MTTQTIEFTKVNNDINGNPRYVCHFLNLITEKDEQAIDNQIIALKALANGLSTDFTPSKTEYMYREALHKAKRIGGKKFHNKQYGGGIVFKTYNIHQTEKDILALNSK